ncbi:AvrPphF family type III effector [Brenneria izbisi]|uniref:AvrPphF family type III effector n=1 Tax=Brenneria izbisi TaxID=2939450 RepID=A0AA42C3Q9_9GAMM|nr:AvrPphF family type III effector [Brenneria izbisi]MCV9877494.1 AvrPphF family type III effector [Brenneria izbisi]MCV9880940.1 AvrPphF family type III effector [Brenneria izbisi]
MGNMCISGSSSRYDSSNASSPSASPVRVNARTQSGEELTSIRQLSSPERERFLNEYDPMRSIPGLNSESSVYRTTPREFVKNGMIAGNPKSSARIFLHEQLNPNYLSRQRMNVPIGTAYAYIPKESRAQDLGTPSLNVMYGSNALEATRTYAQTSRYVTVEMRLGDFLERGGKVYKDVSSFSADDDTAHALIVTLPKGKKVPANIID